MRKRLTAIILALAVTVSLVACGSGSADTPKASKTEESEVSSTEEAVEEEPKAEAEKTADTSDEAIEFYTTTGEDGTRVLTDEAKMILRNNIVKELVRYGVDENSFNSEDGYVVSSPYFHAQVLWTSYMDYYNAAFGPYADEESRKGFTDVSVEILGDGIETWDDIIAESCWLTFGQLFGEKGYDVDLFSPLLSFGTECEEKCADDDRPDYVFNVFGLYSDDDLAMVKEDSLPTYETSKENEEAVQMGRDIIAALKEMRTK